MCKNATSTASTLLAAVEPTLVSLLTITGVASTPDGVAAIAALQAAQKALAGWTPGTSAETVVQALDAAVDVVNAIPEIPAEAKGLVSIVVAGITAVIAVVEANSPAPVTPTVEAGTATLEETTVMHQADVVEKATAKVGVLIPGFKRSIFTSPAHQYRKAWNEAADKAGPKYATLKQ